MPFSASESQTTQFGAMWFLGTSDRLTAHRPGIYRVTVNGVWAANANGTRWLQPSRTWGNPPLTQHKVIDYVTTPALAAGKTAQSITTEVALEQNDSITLQANTCGANVQLDTVRMSLTWLRDK